MKKQINLHFYIGGRGRENKEKDEENDDSEGEISERRGKWKVIFEKWEKT